MTRARSVWLAYHDIEPPGAGPAPATAAAYHVSVARFRSHLDAIRATGLPVLTASESAAAAGDHLVLTFDDGWTGSLTAGVECLLEAGLRATFFVTSGHVGGRAFASPEQLREARRAGMEVGAHGSSHRLLAELPPAEADAELRESKAFLEDVLGEPVAAGSAPGGSWSVETARLAREAGYACFSGSRPGVNRAGEDLFDLRRVFVRAGTGAPTVARWARFSLLDQVARHAALEVPRRLLGARRYALLRRRLLGTRPEEDVLVLDER